ncbi:MAG: hypothetical protein LBC45_00400 [Chlamydiales bacterium]|jgi:hypothetical protein|nr:hypothetical protein [Chlamydiales bacterium]
MVGEILYQNYEKIKEHAFFHIHEQNENGLTQKVKKLSENYILSIVTQALIGSLALKACGFSLGTSFPIALALLVTKSFIATWNYAKTAIKATLNDAKIAIQTTAQKAVSPFVRVANVVHTIFKRVFASFTSLALLSLHHLMRTTYPSHFRKVDCPLPITLPAIETVENQELTPEISTKIPFKPPRLSSCDSEFIIREEDSKESYLLRGLPIDFSAPKEEFLSFLREKHLPGTPMTLLKKNAPWVFFLERSSDRSLKESTSKRLGTAVTDIKSIPHQLLLEGIPVNLRLKL